MEQDVSRFERKWVPVVVIEFGRSWFHFLHYFSSSSSDFSSNQFSAVTAQILSGKSSVF
jgi:hypothetical protein